jgi:hypothetical protein
MAKKKPAPKSPTLPSTDATLRYPWPVEGKGFTPDQVVATAEHILAISGWVPVERVIGIVYELLELADDVSIEFEDEQDKQDAARYALLAARLMAAHDLTPQLHPQVADRLARCPF